MPGERLELSFLAESDLKSDAATNYATRAHRITGNWMPESWNVSRISVSSF